MPPKPTSVSTKDPSPSLSELYEPGAFVVVRTPLLPLRPADGAAMPPRQAAQIPVVREALHLASPELSQEIQRWLASGKEDRKLERTIHKYLARMTGRCTPFGLFAGVSTGTLGGESTRLEVPPLSEARRRTRLDMHALCAVVAAAARKPQARRALRYRPSGSLYEASGRLRYAELDPGGRSEVEHYPLVDVEPTAHLRAVLRRAAAGASFEQMVEALQEEMGQEVTRQDAEEYLERLIEAQIVVPEVCPPITGPLPAPRAVSELGQVPALAEEAAALGQVQALIEALDREPLGAPVELHEAIAGRLRALDVPARSTIQVDLHKPAPGLRVSERLARRVLDAVSLLQRLHRAPADALYSFREAFQRRYEGREMPLAEVLDEDLGLGFDGMRSGRLVPLLDGLALGASAAAPGPPLGAHERWLLRHLEPCLRRGDDELVLTADDLPPGQAPRRLPEGFVVMLSLARKAGGSVDEALLVEPSISSPSGAQLLGRFGHVDPDLARALAAHTEQEAARSPGVILADVAHLPRGRLGNVMLRPVLREHEIPYHGRSGAQADRQILLSDLRVSVVGARVVLRSARLDREVRIRNTNAHNFYGFNNLPIYTFLCALQSQDTDLAHGFSWGVLDSLPRLPRVRLGDVVLQRARWRLTTDELEAAAGAGEALGGLRESKGLPRHVALVDGDNLLPVDLDSALSVEALLSSIKKRHSVLLEEIFPTADDLVAEGPEGRYPLEMMVPFLRRATEDALPGGVRREGDEVRRSFGPGSEWLYLKIYGAESQQEDLLVGDLLPVLRALRQEGALERWFFLRYHDPEPHLRVRLRGEPGAVLGRCLPALRLALDRSPQAASLWKTQIDTYEREIERYGGARGVELAEHLFWVDSEQSAGVIEAMEASAHERRWQVVAAAMHGWMVDFGLDLDARLRFCRESAEGYAREMSAMAHTRHALGERFRGLRKELAVALSGEAGEEKNPALAVLDRWREQRATVVNALQEAERAGALTLPLWTLLRSYLHMTCTRMFPEDSRRQEYVLYEYLTRHYESEMARARAPRKEKKG